MALAAAAWWRIVFNAWQMSFPFGFIEIV